ncbi:MAG: alpha/beta hydrolase [Pseudomonadota bacterium]
MSAAPHTPKRLREQTVESVDGTRLAVREAGPEGAPAILCLHGWSQHGLCWQKQLQGGLTARFRVIAPDLRGHGASDKPREPSAYDHSAPWAGDVAALIETLGLHRPILVGWSMGGWAIADYLRVHGAGALGGVVTIGTVPRIGAAAPPELMARRRPEVTAEGMYSANHLAEIDAAIAFAKAMMASPPSKRDLAFLTGLMMHCPPGVRRPCRTRSEDWREAWAGLDRPALIIQGAAERVCFAEQAEELADTIPNAQLETYPGCGHMAFWERPDRFEADLAAFSDRVQSEALA